MENRTRHFLLKLMILVALVLCVIATPEGALAETPMIEPDVQPRKITPPKIDSGNFEITAVAGMLNIEDFESSFMYGARLAYHISESFFVEAGVGFAEAGQTSFERLAGDVQLLPDNDRDYLWYNLNLGYKLLPGQAFFPGGYAFNTNFYITAGAGATDFAGDNQFTLNYGAGYQVLLRDNLSVHLNVRQYVYETDILGSSKNSFNTELSTGISLFF
ncbi:outer membrane beta-barrel domain-containing protein [uncultured Marinobacter sp.]|uniref:outer membrane beta-barrel domain-containing protein n=1 Tax=uncultured Marinobacter sp. TaxID=187379 RepID=UPI0030DB9C44